MAAYIDKIELWNRLATVNDKAEIFVIINEMPVVERRVCGKWLHDEDDYTFADCSVCGEVFDVNEKSTLEIWKMFCEEYQYCPHCGAKMEEVTT